ncbi:MAG: ATP-binding protein [Leptolyngbyaceae cyanobacterium]
MLVGFSLIFSVVFAGAFLWFYNFTTDKTISRLRTDLKSTLEGAAEGVDVDELMALYAEGQPNDAGFSDDPRYLNQLEWFATVKSIEPRAWLYSFVVIGPPELDGKPPLAREDLNHISIDQYETIWLVDLWAKYPEFRDERAAKFLYEDWQTSSSSVLVKYQQRLVEEEQIYKDDWGTWLSAFAPLKDENGNVVAILGLDIEADYVFKLQDEIRKRVLLSFVITYGILFILIYALSGVLTKHLTDLTSSAERIAAGDYRQSLDLARLHRLGEPTKRLGQNRGLTQLMVVGHHIRRYLRDEMSILAQAFEVMVDSIQTRERMIREGKAKEDKMRRDLEVARELNALKSRFVSIVSHEFRTPLTVLRTSTELLEKYGHIASDTKKEDYYRRIRGAISNMTQLLEDVLVEGKSDAGKLEFKPIAIDLEAFCRTLSDDMQHSVGLKHTIQFNYADGRSPQAIADSDGHQVYLDPNLLRPILSNLLSNAIKYSEPKTVVRMTTVLKDDSVIVEVKDQGIGIPADDQPHLFEVFHRASNVEAIRGTGLGLAIVKQCSDRHNGKISFVSQENIGTTFTVQLPTVAPAEALDIDDDRSDPLLARHPEAGDGSTHHGHLQNGHQSGVGSGAMVESTIARKPHS